MIKEVWIDFDLKQGQVVREDEKLILSVSDWITLIIRIKPSNPPYMGDFYDVRLDA